MKRLIALVVLLLVLPASAQAWWNDEWTVRKKITLDTQAAGVPVEADAVPVLVRLSTGNFDFLSAKEDGSDIRFVAEDDTTPLMFHIERYDSINELAFVWVQVPKLAGNNAGQHVWLYYGNEQAPADSKTSYDASQLMVYHLSEAQGLPQDATANGNHVSKGKLVYAPDGLIAGGVRLAGDGGMVTDSPALQAAREFTFSAWIKPEKADGELLALGGLTLSLSGGVPVLAVNGAKTRAAAPIPVNAWHHIAVTGAFTEGQGTGEPGFTLYVDGKSVATAAGALTPTASLRIGGGLVGEMDEVQVSTVARSAAWLAAQAESQGQAGRLVKYGEDEVDAGGSEVGIWGGLFAALTVDGWVAIGILAVMLVIALWIMYVKAIYVNRVDKANRLFMRKFRELSTDLGAIDKAHGLADEFKHSSLYHLYHIAATELSHRFKDTDAAHMLDKNLSPQSLEAIRASLNTGLVKEITRMNRLMVLLTIAISGGPFIGLLGTVLGVMITFAVIAATGDVNVAAIAPGIAAALLATAAGMAVAIPALFGYNYLNSRIKNITSDMRVFNDEMITKLAENYSR